jgi:hypothetical protein
MFSLVEVSFSVVCHSMLILPGGSSICFLYTVNSRVNSEMMKTNMS